MAILNGSGDSESSASIVRPWSSKTMVRPTNHQTSKRGAVTDIVSDCIFLILSVCAFCAIACNSARKFSNVECICALHLHVHPSPVTLGEANAIVKGNMGGPFDGRPLTKEILMDFEQSLSRDVAVDPNESIDAGKYLLGTSLFWTDIRLDSLDPLENSMYFKKDGDRSRSSGFWHANQCYESDYYANLFKSHDAEQKFRIVVETICTGHKSSPIALTRICRDTCLNLIPEGSSSKHFVAYYKNEKVSGINLNWPIVKVRSDDNKYDFVFHAKKVTQLELMGVLKHVGAEELSISRLNKANWNRIRDAFNGVNVPADVMRFWMRDGKLYEVPHDLLLSDDSWCPGSYLSPVIIPTSFNRLARWPRSREELFRRSFLTVSNGSLCVERSEHSEPLYYLAYQMPVKKDARPDEVFVSFFRDSVVAAAWKWLPNIPLRFI